ncbi:MAG TPA: helix-turn-helix domain-containing protein [Capsulimonadaceae bacterium]|jgi:DNA-binding HxlR family transcriptional regulator
MTITIATKIEATEEACKKAMPSFCPIAASMDVLHEKWTLHVVHALLLGHKRFNEIGHALGGINPSTLRERLRRLENEGIVKRHVIATIPPWVEYELTDKGHALKGVMDAMADWARQWMEEPTAPVPENAE